MEGRGNPASGGIACHHVCGLVLARGGSVRVPKKNVRSIAGLPLLAWVLHPMLDCKSKFPASYSHSYSFTFPALIFSSS